MYIIDTGTKYHRSGCGYLEESGGLDALELAIDAVYRAVSPDDAIRQQGFIVALGYRVITLIVATFGMYLWIVGRRKVSELLRQVQAEQST